MERLWHILITTQELNEDMYIPTLYVLVIESFFVHLQSVLHARPTELTKGQFTIDGLSDYLMEVTQAVIQMIGILMHHRN